MAKKQKYDYDLIVIGSGASGSVAADIVAGAGKRVAVIESDSMGGQTSSWGDVPTRALLEAARAYNGAKAASALGIRTNATGFNFPSIQAWKELVVKRTGIENTARYYQSRGIGVYRGQAHFISPHEITVNRRHLSAAHFLIASGATWRTFEGPVAERATPLTPRTALDLTKPPRSIFIVGGGSTGTEFAELFASFGSSVTIAEESTRLLPKEDQEVSQLVEAVFTKRRGIKTLTKAKVTGILFEGISPRIEYLRAGETHTMKADQVLIATGKTPMIDIGLENAGVVYSNLGIETNEWLQTSASHIYAAGDVLGEHMYTHVSVAESRIVANNILRKQKATPDYRAIPRVTFLTPEIASVGMSEESCLKRDLAIKTAVVPINTVARANLSNNRDGFIKVITDRHGVILGASVVATNAGEIVHELTLAIQYGLTASQVAATMHAFPSWSEAVRLVCAKIKV